MTQEQPAEAPKEKMVIPRVFDACPVCHSKNRLGAGYIQQLKDEGILHKDSFNGGLMHQIPMLDQAHPPAILGPVLKVPIVLVYWDVCECGNMYCTKFDVVQQPMQMQMQRSQQRPPFGGLPGHNIKRS